MQISGPLLRFIASKDRLLEEIPGSQSTIFKAWRAYSGKSPRFNGSMVSGFHFQGERQGVRVLVVTHWGRYETVRAVADLIQQKHQLERIDLSHSALFQAKKLRGQLFHPETIDVYPPINRAGTLEAVVAEHLNEPGTFIHRDEMRTGTAYVGPAKTADDAFVFADQRHAEWWLRIRRKDPMDFELHYLAGLKAMLEHDQSG